jgi:hypothetical protein
MTRKEAAIQHPTGTNTTIPRQKEDTKLTGRDVFYMVRAEMLYAGQVRS